MPNVPTVAESGFPGYDVQSWYGMCAPAGTPVAILDKLNTDIHTVLRIPEIQQRLTELGIDLAPSTREEFEQYIRAEIVRWAKVIKDAGIAQQ
jgi:tripartite-type tricarboxylate transporter receptor subunit TctC